MGYRVLALGLVVPLGLACGCGGGGSGAPVAATQNQAQTPLNAAETGPVPSGSAAPPKPVAAVGKPRIPKGMAAGYMVYDRVTKKVTVRYNPHKTFRSASVVKLIIAADYLGRLGASAQIPAADRALLQKMLRSSDDHAATVFWARGGKRAVITRMAPKMGLTDSAPPPAAKPGFWGYTAISASDIVRVYRYVLEKARPKDRAFILEQLHKSTKCGTDRFDQSFGIPSALPRPWGVKQGWSGFGDIPPTPCKGATTQGLTFRPAMGPDLGLGRPVLHTTGVVGKDDRRIVVVLSLQPAGGSYKSSMARLTQLTREVYRAGGG